MRIFKWLGVVVTLCALMIAGSCAASLFLDLRKALILGNWLLLAGLVLMGAAGVAMAFSERDDTPDPKRTLRFQGLLDEQFALGTVASLANIQTLAEAAFGGRRYEPAELLSSYVAHCLEKRTDSSTPPQPVADQDRRARVTAIQTLLEEVRREEPYAGVPAEQRRLLRNSKAAVEAAQKETAILNLDELGQVLIATNRIHTRMEKTNRWAVPLAVIGVILTVVFGITSLVVSSGPRAPIPSGQTETVKTPQPPPSDTIQRGHK